MKNLKMFAIALLAMLVMVCGVKAACSDLSVDYGEGSLCYTDATFAQIFNDMAAKDVSKVTITVGDSSSALTLGSGASRTIPADYEVTLDLNGNDVTIDNPLVVEGTLKVINSGDAATITTNGVATIFQVKSGATLDVSGKVTLKSAKVIASPADDDKKAIIFVTGGDATKVTVSKDVTVDTTGVGVALYSDASNYGRPATGESSNVTLNIAGKWTAGLYVIQVDGQITGSENTVVNVTEGEFTSNGTYAFYASGDATWNVTGGKITGKDAFGIRKGEINISGTPEFIGTAKTTGQPTGTSSKINVGAALRLIHDTRIQPLEHVVVNIDGGSFKSKETDPNAYAVVIDDATWFADEEEVKISITNGVFESTGKNSAHENKAAIYIGGSSAENFLTNHPSMIKNGQFKNSIATVADPKYPDPTVAALLTKGADIKTVGGNVIVGNGNVENPKDPVVDPGTQTPGEQQPGTTDDGNQGGTSNVPNPNTNDNILVYAGLGLVSLVSIAFTAKKRED